MRPQFVRDMTGQNLLPLLSNAAAVLSTTTDVISTDELMRRIRREYAQTHGRIPAWLTNECYGEWLAVNAKRLQGMALEIEERRAARMFAAHAA